MTKVSEIMTREVVTVGPDTRITEAARLLLDNHYNGLPVVNEEGELIGILCQSDIIFQQRKMPMPTIFTLLDGIIPLTSMSHLEKEVQKMSATNVEQAMTPDPVTTDPDSSIEDVAELMVRKNYHTIPVVQDRKLVGILGKEDVLKTLAR
jgi:CBS domain-containing protein